MVGKINYTMGNFGDIIAKYAAGQYDTDSAATVARRAAYDLAAEWAPGRFAIPPEEEFRQAIADEREKNGRPDPL